jgi:hypothetical protein
MNLDSYLAGYLDRRMGMIIDEWQIATRGDLADLTRRFHRVQDELTSLKNFERETESRIATLEERTHRIREQMK